MQGSRPRHALTLVLLVGGSAGALLTLSSDVATPADPETVIGGGTTGTLLGPAPQGFEISGDVNETVVPGAMAAVKLTLTNIQDVDLSVTELQMAVTEVHTSHGAPPCTPNDFTVRQARLSALALRAGASGSLGELGLQRARWPRIGLVARGVARERCLGVSLPLSYSGSATVVAS